MSRIVNEAEVRAANAAYHRWLHDAPSPLTHKGFALFLAGWMAGYDYCRDNRPAPDSTPALPLEPSGPALRESGGV